MWLVTTNKVRWEKFLSSSAALHQPPPLFVIVSIAISIRFVRYTHPAHLPVWVGLQISQIGWVWFHLRWFSESVRSTTTLFSCLEDHLLGGEPICRSVSTLIWPQPLPTNCNQLQYTKHFTKNFGWPQTNGIAKKGERKSKEELSSLEESRNPSLKVSDSRKYLLCNFPHSKSARIVSQNLLKLEAGDIKEGGRGLSSTPTWRIFRSYDKHLEDHRLISTPRWRIINSYMTNIATETALA